MAQTSETKGTIDLLESFMSCISCQMSKTESHCTSTTEFSHCSFSRENCHGECNSLYRLISGLLVVLLGYVLLTMIYKKKMTKKFSNSPRTLFIITSMVSGGTEKALLTTLNIFPSRKHIDVCLLERGGIFESMMPSDVTILNLQEALTKNYQTAIAYHTIDLDEILGKVKAKKKIQWIHIDPRCRPWYMELLIKHLNEIDELICVSDNAVEYLKSDYPALGAKARCIQNPIDSQLIKHLADHPSAISENLANQLQKWNSKKLSVITVARLSEEKGVDIAVEVHGFLNKQGIDFCWYVVGEGPHRGEIERLISEHQLQDKFILLGEAANPFPYVKKADIFALLSRTEGYGLVVAEAKILAKPILLSDFVMAYEHVKSGVNGLIAKGEVESLAESLKVLLKRSDLRKQFEAHLQGYEYDNTNIKAQLEEVINCHQ